MLLAVLRHNILYSLYVCTEYGKEYSMITLPTRFYFVSYELLIYTIWYTHNFLKNLTIVQNQHTNTLNADNAKTAALVPTANDRVAATAEPSTVSHLHPRMGRPTGGLGQRTREADPRPPPPADGHTCTESEYNRQSTTNTVYTDLPQRTPTPEISSGWGNSGTRWGLRQFAGCKNDSRK